MHKSIKEIKWYAFESDEIPAQYKKPYRYIYRNVNAWLCFILQFFPITPNMISACMSIFTFIGAICFISFNPWFWLLGVLLLYFAELLDWSDGTIARIKNIKSPLISKYLDAYFHEVPRQFVFLFIGLSAYFYTGKTFWIMIGFMTLVLQILTVHLHRLKETIVFAAFPGNAESLLDMDLKDNAMTKNNNKIYKLFELAVFPLKQIKSILLISVIISFYNYPFIYHTLFFYFNFILFRYIAFFIATYITLRGLEKDVKSK